MHSDWATDTVSGGCGVSTAAADVAAIPIDRPLSPDGTAGVCSGRGALLKAAVGVIVVVLYIVRRRLPVVGTSIVVLLVVLAVVLVLVVVVLGSMLVPAVATVSCDCAVLLQTGGFTPE